MFKPVTTCVISTSSGPDVYGMPMPSAKVVEKCFVVMLNVSSQKTQLRPQLSSSRGSAAELESDALILLAANTSAKIDDEITVMGYVLKIASKFARQDLDGNLDHFEITCTYVSG